MTFQVDVSVLNTSYSIKVIFHRGLQLVAKNDTAINTDVFVCYSFFIMMNIDIVHYSLIYLFIDLFVIIVCPF